MEARGGSLLLGELGSLLGFRESQRVTALVATTGWASTTTAVVVVLVPVVGTLLVLIGIAGGSRRRRRRGSHWETRQSGLIAAVRVVGRCVH